MQLNKITVALAASVFLSGNLLAQSVSGTITQTNGQAITNAKVSIVNTHLAVDTDQHGQFIFSDVSTGNIELHVTAANFNHVNKRILVKDDKPSNIDVVMNYSVMEVVDVFATPLHSSNIESAIPVNVISSDELRLKQSSTLGETLKNEVGVHSSYYGPVASSPIIRGLDGPRVLITQNGLDVGDASRVGADHVVSSETSTATQIEVLRGPATLFYGSGAIGGVVNVVDNRVPTYTDNEVDYLIKHNDVADENEASININSGFDNFALHLDGFWRESNNYNIPGFAELEDHTTHEEEDEHDEHEEHEETEGVLENSAAKSSGFTIGSSYLLDNGFIGFSYGRINREYGIPGHAHHDEEEESESDIEEEHQDEFVYGDLKQDRYQLLSELSFNDSFINRLTSKLAYTDYQHQEIENQMVGTQFNNEMLETRFDLFHKEYSGWKGAWTLHYKESDFKSVGDEAFSPPSTTEMLAFAWLEEKHIDNVLWQLGFRVEHVELSADADHFAHEEHDDHEEHDEHESEITHFKTQNFTPISASIGMVWDYQQGYNLGLSASFSQRAPSASELFSNGAHIGTNTFEVGALFDVHQEGNEVHTELNNQDVSLESAYNLDITWRKFEGNIGFVLSAFYNHIDDYYYQQDTGFFFTGDEHEHDHEEEAEEALPIFSYQQNDVDIFGFEAELIYQINDKLQTTIFTDYINAELSDGGNLPRIPPMRLGGQLNYQTDSFSAQISINHSFKQSSVALKESETDGYTMLDANFSYYLNGLNPLLGTDTVLFIKADNLTNEEARVHSSFLKNIAPLPGRGFSLGIRGSF